MKRVVLLSVVAVLGVALAAAGCAKKQQTAAAPQDQGAPRGMIGGSSGPGDAGGTMPPAGGQGQTPSASGPPAQGQMPPMPPGHEQMTGTLEAPPTGSPTAAAGIAWTTPKRWTISTDRPMRVATYVIPAAAGDAAGAECGVFYFGPNQGGSVEDNIQRWVGQFSNAGPAERSARDLHGFKVSMVQVAGTYLSPAGPMMQSTGTRPGYALLGAIVAAPQGSVYFKLTGPKKTVDAAKGDFDALLSSIKKE